MTPFLCFSLSTNVTPEVCAGIQEAKEEEKSEPLDRFCLLAGGREAGAVSWLISISVAAP